MRRIAALLLVLTAALPAASSAADEFENARELHRQGQRAEAMARLDQHLEKQPRDARARFLKGVILSEENKRAEAIAVFISLTQDFPELPEPYNNLAVLYAAQGDYDRAREALLMAIRTHPDYATAHENLGDVYAAMARQAYEKTIELDKKTQTAPQKLSLLRELLPKRRDASAVEQAPAGAAVAQPPPAPVQPRAVPLPSIAGAGDQPATVPAGDGKTDAGAESPALAVAPQITSAAPAPALQASTQPTAPVQRRLEAVLRTVDEWARAWSRRDANAYLAFYAPGFRPPKGEPRAKWEATRRADFAKLRDVSVKIISPQVTFRDAQHASVTFAQDYSSATDEVSGRKTLELVQEGERWLIQQEAFVRR